MCDLVKLYTNLIHSVDPALSKRKGETLIWKLGWRVGGGTGGTPRYVYITSTIIHHLHQLVGRREDTLFKTFRRSLPVQPWDASTT